MTPHITTESDWRKLRWTGDAERLLRLLINQGFTGRLVIHLSQGGTNSMETEERLKPPS
jgi:hypothetical protein